MDEEPGDELQRLSDLDNISTEAILSVIRDHYYTAHPYTFISHSALLCINPQGNTGSRNDDETLRMYTGDFRAVGKERRLLRTSLPPHIFQVAADAYYYMYRTGQDQSIVLRWVV